MQFIITESNLDFASIFAMIAMFIMWVIGFKSICMPGNIFHPFQKLIEIKVTRSKKHTAGRNVMCDETLEKLMPAGYKSRVVDSVVLFAVVEEFLQINNLLGGDDYNYKIHLIYNLQSNQYKNTPTQYWYAETKYFFPAFIRKPLISCATCMPSVHGLFVYTIFVHFNAWFFNPVEWIFLAICSAGPCSIIWKLRTILFDKKTPKY